MRQILLGLLVIEILGAPAAAAESAGSRRGQRQELAPAHVTADLVDAISGKATTFADTTWIAHWNFDNGGQCDDSGWERFDFRIDNDGLLFWSVNDTFSGVGSIAGGAAVLGHHDLCWVYPDGYDNFWYQAIRFEFQVPSFLSFDYLLDSESGYDFLQVELDPDCASFDLVDFDTDPTANSQSYRRLIWSATGFDTLGVVDSLALDYQSLPSGGVHCAYISFFADGAYSPADGLQASTLGIASVVDNIRVTGTTELQEDFEGPVDPRISFVNLRESTPFGEWARLYYYITDNDACVTNTSCAWLWTDHTTPTTAYQPDMAFGPGKYVIKNWLDDVVVGPWTSWSSVPSTQSILSFRRFPGNFFSTGRIAQNWSIRGRYPISNTDTPAPGDSIDCTTSWAHASQWNSLSTFKWRTEHFDLTEYIDPRAQAVQVRFRVTDWQWISGASPPTTLNPGPGPFVDDVRIGRVLASSGSFSGPRFSEGIDSRSQAQDAFATFQNGIAGEHFSPSQDRFGSAAFSNGADLAVDGSSPNLITGDSIHVEVHDVENAGGIVSVQVFASIVEGPHAGKAPPPWSVGANGFFAVLADSVRSADGQIVADAWSVDLDDDYFRGGDKLLYFWFAEDGLGHQSSHPSGLTELPGSVEQAVQATAGLLEVSFLPGIAWDAAYLARIAADPHGKLQPTPVELANSSQSTCLLYVQAVNGRRRSASRTSFLYTLDEIGYHGLYDVYDQQGLGNTNNQLGGRASVAQATGYAAIVFDAGALAPGTPILPDGVDRNNEKIDQNQWYRNWLAQAAQSEAGQATLWIIGSNFLEEKPFASLYTQDMGLGLVAGNQALGENPQVLGESSFTFHNGENRDFGPDDFFGSQPSCDDRPSYDGLTAGGTAVVTHRWTFGATAADACIVMNANPVLQWSTIAMTLPWADFHDPSGPPQPVSARQHLAERILSAVLSPDCTAGGPTDTRPVPASAVPPRTVLHQNHPNPFNPTTTIRFDLAASGTVKLQIFDVAGRLVRKLMESQASAGYGHSVTWDGRDDKGRVVASGVYLYRIEAVDVRATRKLLVMR